MKNVLILGGVIMDKYLLVDYYPQRGQDTFIKEAFEVVGGCSINVAVTLNNLGLMPYIVSTVGDDEGGDDILYYLKQKKLPLDYIYKKKDAATGFCYNIIDDEGERTFLTQKGSESNFPEALNHIEMIQFSFVYLTGYYLLGKDASKILTFLKKLKDTQSCSVMFDPSPLVGHMDLNILESILDISDIIVPNQTEADILINSFNLSEGLEEWCLERGIGKVVVKAGENGVTAKTKKQTFFQKAYNVDVLDGTGAGDSFAGGLIYGLNTSLGLSYALKIASACGAITTTALLPHIEFSKKEIDNLIERNESQ